MKGKDGTPRKRGRAPKAEPAHTPPLLGPRRQPTRPRALPARRRAREPYDPGVPRPRERDPWVDEGTID